MKKMITFILIMLLLTGCTTDIQAPEITTTNSSIPTISPAPSPSPSPVAAELPVLQTINIPPSTGHKLKNIILSRNTKVEKIDSMMVYKSEPIIMSSDKLMRLANKIGIENATLKDTNKAIIIEDDVDKIILYDKSCSSLSISLFDNSMEEYTGEMLQDIEYIDIARDFLLETNLLTNDYIQDGSVIENRIITETRDGKEYSYPTEMTVTFRRKALDGFIVGGVAPRIIVSLDLEGNILRAAKLQRKFTPLMTYPLKSLEEAMQDILDGKGNLYNDTPSSNGTVTSVELCYYNDNQEQQYYLLPVYYIKGKCGNGDFSAYVHAVRDEYLEYAN